MSSSQLPLQSGELEVIQGVSEGGDRVIDPLATPLDLQIANVTIGVSLGLVMGALGVECIRQILTGGSGPLGPHRWNEGKR